MSRPQRSAAPALARPAGYVMARPAAPGQRPVHRSAVPGARQAVQHPMAARPLGMRPDAGSPMAPVAQRPAPRTAISFLTVTEVAAIMRVSKMTVYRLVHGGELSAVRVGRSFRVPEPAVREYLAGARTDVA